MTGFHIALLTLAAFWLHALIVRVAVMFLDSRDRPTQGLSEGEIRVNAKPKTGQVLVMAGVIEREGSLR